ncbi:MAG: hypothetical protein Q9210_000763 [Variospora velana]
MFLALLLTKHVWAKTEKPILTASGGSCTRIIKVDPDDFSKRCILWDREDNYDDSKMARCGLENQPVPAPPTGASTYEPGRCRVHVTQYQKNEPQFPSPNYRLDLTLYDNANAVVGTNFGVDAPTGEVDDSAVLFKYAGKEWGSNDQAHECDIGGYEDGNRDGDCKFDC